MAKVTNAAMNLECILSWFFFSVGKKIAQTAERDSLLLKIVIHTNNAYILFKENLAV